MKYKLNELVDLKIGRTPSRNELQWFNQRSDDWKWVSIKDMGVSGKFISQTNDTISQEAQKIFRIPVVKAGTVILSFKLTVGRVGIAAIDLLTNEAIAQLPVRDNSLLLPEYLYYYLKAYPFETLGSTSSIATAVNCQYLKEMEIDVPSIERQAEIVAILSPLDSKIQINNRINDNLSKQAALIFRKEFLSLATLPYDWRQGSLIDIADYLNGLAMQNYRPVSNDPGLPVLKIRELRQGYCDDESDKCSSDIDDDYVIHDGDVIFSWSGSLLVDFWTGGPCGLNQHLFKVTSGNFDKWFYYSWTKHYQNHFAAIAADMATTMGHIKRGELAKAIVSIPSENDYRRIGALLDPIYRQIVANKIQNKKLVSLRDSLIPKLLSGDICNL